MPLAYLAGPDVFLPDAPAHATQKAAICARHGLAALPPLNEDVASLAAMTHEPRPGAPSSPRTWR